MIFACSFNNAGPSSSGRALARDSRFATSFFEGRRRFLVLVLAFSMRAVRMERLIRRLSFLEEGTWKGSSEWGGVGLRG
jgi:hypothetical protein